MEFNIVIHINVKLLIERYKKSNSCDRIKS